jgi:hypothetical protein
MKKTSREKTLAKLDRFPAGVNFVRLLGDSVETTTFNIVDFAKSQIQFSYQTGHAAVKDRIELGLDRATGLKAISRSCAPVGRPHNASYFEAFCDYDDRRHLSSSSAIEFERPYFMLRKGLLVPVAPLSVLREMGRFVPIFSCGWNAFNFSTLQYRFNRTMHEYAFLSLTDFQKSPAEFCFFPKRTKREDEKVIERREAQIVMREDFE